MTRAEPGASRTAERLWARGFEPVVAPLIAITPIPQPAPDLSDVAALAFTSVNGVMAFAALTDTRDRRVFTVGDATAEAARQAGFQDVQSADGALPDLARLIETSRTDGDILLLTAREPSGDLAALTPNARVRMLAVYAASETGEAAPETVDAALLHSARAARALARLWPGLKTTLPVVALSDQVAAPMRGLTSPVVAAQPREADLLEALGNLPPPV